MAFYGSGKIEHTSQWPISVFTDKICKLHGRSQTKFLQVEFQPHCFILLRDYML